MPKTKAKTSKGINKAIHREAKHLKGKGPWSHLTWAQAHGVARCIVTGVCVKKGGKSKKRGT